MENSIIQQISGWVIQSTYKNIPLNHVDIIKKSFIDTLAVSYAGKEEPVMRKLKQYVQQSSGDTTCVLHEVTGYLPNVALYNGTLAHALDYDDVSPAMQGHPSTTLVPALLTVSETESGEEILNAYRCGFEVLSYIGRIVGFKHYELGWHPTISLGVIGATVAVGKLKKLPEEQLAHAIGIAASMAGGIRQNFGTMTKPLHAGIAVRNAIEAVKLAQLGVTSSIDALEGKFGFLNLFTERNFMLNSQKIGFHSEFDLTGIGIKRYPCCYATHRFIDAALNIGHIDVRSIEEIQVIGPTGIFTPLNYTRQTKQNEAKFSVEYTVCAALIDQKIGLSSFDDAAVQRREVQALMQKVIRIEDDTIPCDLNPIDEGWIELHIQTATTLYKEKVHFPQGSFQQPLTFHQLKEKAADCFGEAFQEEWFSYWQDFDQVDHYKQKKKVNK